MDSRSYYYLYKYEKLISFVNFLISFKLMEVLRYSYLFRPQLYVKSSIVTKEKETLEIGFKFILNGHTYNYDFLTNNSRRDCTIKVEWFEDKYYSTLYITNIDEYRTYLTIIEIEEIDCKKLESVIYCLVNRLHIEKEITHEIFSDCQPHKFKINQQKMEKMEKCGR